MIAFTSFQNVFLVSAMRSRWLSVKSWKNSILFIPNELNCGEIDKPWSQVFSNIIQTVLVAEHTGRKGYVTNKCNFWTIFSLNFSQKLPRKANLWDSLNRFLTQKRVCHELEQLESHRSTNSIIISSDNPAVCSSDRLLQQPDHRGPRGAATQRHHLHPGRSLPHRGERHRHSLPGQHGHQTGPAPPLHLPQGDSRK